MASAESPGESATAMVEEAVTNARAKETAPLLEAISSGKAAAFAEELVAAIIASLSKVAAHSKQASREKALKHFHIPRVATLAELWKKHQDACTIPATRTVEAQSINRCLFNKLLLQHFCGG